MSPQWAAPRDTMKLEPGSVHVWRVRLDLPRAEIEDLYRALTRDERERAARMFRDADRQRFVAARGRLRAILSRYLAGIEPGRVRFAYGPRGKPSLSEDYGTPGLCFSLSHSRDLAMVGLCLGHDLGVDVEYVRPDVAGAEIAARFFSPREIAGLRALPAELRLEGFFSCWTRKEAYLKAIGEGLWTPLHDFSVSVAPGRPAALLEVRDDEGEAGHWSLLDLRPAPGYIAALAVRGSAAVVERWEI